MSKKSNHISEEEFRRYLKDQMTPAERHAFERQMQKDPFGAEAMEGFQEISTQNYEEDIKELKSRISKNKPKKFLVYWIAAASLLFLAATGILWYQLETGTTEKQIAEKTQNQKTQDPALSAPEQAERIATEKKELVKKPEPAESVGQMKSPAKPEKSDQGVSSEKQPAALPDKKSQPESVSEQKYTSAEHDAVIEQGEPEITEKILTEPEIIQRENPSAKTTESHFRSKLNVIAEEQQGVPNRSTQAINAPNLEAQPLKGWETFAQYLDTAAILPAGYSKAKEEISVLAEIDDLGAFVNFYNLSQSPDALFEQAKEILQTGPSWRPAMKNGIPVFSQKEITIVFHKRK